MLPFTNPPQHLCIIRLSAIGDCVHTVAMVQAIQKQWPQTNITWIMGKVEAILLHDLPGINVISFDKKAGLGGYIATWKQLRKTRFDAILHLQSALRASLLTLGLKSRYILGFDKIRASDGQTWFTNIKVPSPASMHVLDGFMAFASSLGIKALLPTWNIPTSKQDDAWARQIINNNPTLLISPAASKPYKNWTIEGYAALADHAADQGLRVILCGGPSQLEQQMAADIITLCKSKPLNLIGKTNLKQLMALIKQAHCVLAPDTGPTHMATAANTPVVGLYAHHNPERTGPYNSQQYVVSVYKQLIEQDTGKSVSTLPWRTRLKSEDAMQHITIESVKCSLDKLLQDFPISKDSN